jgi:hypothetical protein
LCRAELFAESEKKNKTQKIFTHLPQKSYVRFGVGIFRRTEFLLTTTMWNSSPRARTLAFHSKLRIFIPVFPTLTPPPRKTTYRSLPFPKSYKEEGESAHSFCSRATAHSVFFFFFSSAARYVGADQMRQPNIGEEKKRKDMSDERNAFFSFWSPR